MTTLQEIIVDHIRRDGGTQARQGNNEATVEEYTAEMHSYRWQWHQGNALTVFYDGTDYWLGDGFHRIESASRAGVLSVPCEVCEGGRREAVLYACGANSSHGLRRTRDDVRRAIEILLRDEEWGQWSDREIARRVMCSHVTVGTVRREQVSTGQINQLTERKGADGKTRTVPAATATQTPPARHAPVQTAVEEEDEEDEEDDDDDAGEEEDEAETEDAEKPQPPTCTRCGKTQTWPKVFYSGICEACYHDMLVHAEDYTQIGAEEAAERGIEEHTLDVHIPLDWDTWRARALALGATLTLSRLGVAVLALDGAVLCQAHNSKAWPKLCYAIAKAEAAVAPQEPVSPTRSHVETVLAGLLEGRTDAEMRLLYALISARYNMHNADPNHIKDGLWDYARNVFATDMDETELNWILTDEWE